MATTPTISFGIQNKTLLQEPVLEIGSLLYDSYVQETPRSIHEPSAEYVGIDIFPGKGVDRVINLCRSKEIPNEWTDQGGYFNTVHCHCIMEHVTDIFTMAKNMDRVTKTGGVVYITVPFVWRVHRIPLDMWRFTPQAIDYLFPNFEFKKELCIISTRKGDLHAIDSVPELNFGTGLNSINPFFRIIIKLLRKLKLDNGHFLNRALFPEINLQMIGVKKEQPTYTFINEEHIELLH